MKLIDGVKIKQGKFNIPDCTRNDLPEFFKEMGYKVGAEIGVWKGRFTEKFCRIGLKIYAIDKWEPYWIGAKKDGWLEDTQKVQDGFYKIAQWRLEGRNLDCTIVKKFSMEAIKDFKDNSLDFVYIDGNHAFKYIAQDVCEWSKKVRKGGVVSGHDYIITDDWNCHVKQVVDAYVNVFGIKNWYVLGSDHPQPGETRDRIRSWMWIKE